jgi:hypothetical protein
MSPKETWVVLMRVDKPNLLIGPFTGCCDALEGIPEDGWETCSFHDSLEEAREERDKEVVWTLSGPD